MTKFPEIDLSASRVTARTPPFTLSPPAPYTPQQVRSMVHLKRKRYQSIVRRMKQWLTKKKRADSALKKLKRQRKYYERDAAIRRL
jgi:hypothetical protein